jgi:hypothetical protein
MIRSDNERPRPTPSLGRVVKKGSKMDSRCSRRTPAPLSEKTISTIHAPLSQHAGRGAARDPGGRGYFATFMSAVPSVFNQ